MNTLLIDQFIIDSCYAARMIISISFLIGSIITWIPGFVRFLCYELIDLNDLQEKYGLNLERNNLAKNNINFSINLPSVLYFIKERQKGDYIR